MVNIKKYLLMGIVPTIAIFIAEYARGKFNLIDFQSPFALWITFCLIVGFGIAFFVVGLLSKIKHIGLRRINVIFTVIASLVGFGFLSEYKEVSMHEFGESLIYSAIFASIYVMAVFLVRWVYSGFKIKSE